MVQLAGPYNLEHCNNTHNSAGRRVWGYVGIGALVAPSIGGNYAASARTYVHDELPD